MAGKIFMNYRVAMTQPYQRLEREFAAGDLFMAGVHHIGRGAHEVVPAARSAEKHP
jgi:hypothetical protein